MTAVAARLRRLPLRVRLTLAFAGASAVLLVAVGAFVFLQVKHGLDASLDASLRARSAGFARLARTGDPGGLRRALALEGEPAQLVGARGQVLAASPRGGGPPLVAGRRLAAARTRVTLFERREAQRLVARPAGRGRVVVAATSMVQRERALEELGSVLLVGGPLILLLSCSAGYLVASGALRPVERMRRRAAEISAATPDARLPVPRAHDEIGRLGATLNEMLTRLEAAAAHERAFLATASHELRTPLAILRTEIDLALHDAAREEELRAALVSIREEADRLARLAEDLLVLAREQAGGLPVHPRTVALRELAEAVAARWSHAGPGAVRCEVGDGVLVRADPARLEQALGNLVDNAVRHGAPPVRISAEARDGEVVVHVADAGPGLEAGELPPGGRAGGGRAGGFGLGLGIVDAIARAHGGSAGVGTAAGGADVWLALPAASA